ncbi:MAG: NHL repeat-containing protein [Candidatus Poribacteria bacterium]|nr:NHL repeat-containing protein [Candidatus Poribacteria bacterium]
MKARFQNLVGAISESRPVGNRSSLLQRESTDNEATNPIYEIRSIKSTLIKYTHCISIFVWITLLCHISCAVPNPDGKGVLRPPISPNVDIVPSIREREAPPILDVSYVETIGRAGQGAGEFLMPMGLIIDAYGQLYIADAGNNRVQVIDSNGHFVAEFGSYGWRDGEFDFPNDVDLSLDTLYVADTGNNRVQYCNLVNRIFYPLTTTSQDFQFDAPEGIGLGRNGEVFVVDTLNHRWVQFSRNLAPVFTIGSFGSSREQFWNPTDLLVNPHGTVYVVDTGNHRIMSYDFSGNPIRTWGKEGNALGQFREPKRLAIDSWNYLYVTDSGNRRIQVFTAEGRAVIEFTVKTLLNPCGIAVSEKGRVFVTDTDAGDIKVFQMIFKSDAKKAE